MSQTDNKKPTTSTKENSASHSSEMKLKDSQKTDLQNSKLSALPPEDPRLHNTVELTRVSPKYLFLYKVKKFLSRLFGG